ncbi:MAG: hypothetical protein PHW96_00825 [Candidatus Nanoarchaeia archaeon]|nr:hypothetical protein [Candidatus Nanoarchaeia archaeon]
MKKAQVFVIREFFSFLMGLVMLIALSFIYINILLPGVEELAYNYYSRDITAQVDYVLTNVYSSVRLSGYSSSVSFTADMPKKVHNSEYSVAFSGNSSICVNIWQRTNRITGDIYVECRDHSIPSEDISLTGTFLSETGRMKISAVKKSGIIDISLEAGIY